MAAPKPDCLVWSLSSSFQIQQTAAEQDLPERHSGGLIQLQPSTLLECWLSAGSAQLPNHRYAVEKICSSFKSKYILKISLVLKINNFLVLPYRLVHAVELRNV